MNTFRKTAVLGSLLLFGAAGCADLVVDNSNNPDRRRALATAGDVQSLISGSYRTWYEAQHRNAGPAMIFSISSFHHSSTAANFGMLNYSKIPRIPVANSNTHADYGNVELSWAFNYRALAAVAEGLRVVETDAGIAGDMGPEAVLRNQIFGKFLQGIAHGSLALVYDRAYIVDESVAVIDENGAPVLLGEPASYGQVMAAALGYLDEAIAMAKTPAAAGITIPTDVMATTAPLTMPELVRLAHSFKARYRANVARTPAERAAVNWNGVLADVSAGITSNHVNANSIAFSTWTGFGDNRPYLWASTWQQMPYYLWGMADQSGDYQRWLALPLADKAPIFPNGTEPVTVVSPDRRFPQGATLAEQKSGTLVGIRSNALAVQWSNAERGTWRWSQYYVRRFDSTGGCQIGTCIEISRAEMRLLAAEAHFRLGNLQAAADSINKSRAWSGIGTKRIKDPSLPANDTTTIAVPDTMFVGGLNPTNAAGLNTSCVPKLADGTCGNLFEMLKWEKRLETWGSGPYGVTWYFDGRGWGDLFQGTPLQFPIPAEQITVLGIGQAYTFGGVGGEFAAPGNPKYYGTN